MSKIFYSSPYLFIALILFLLYLQERYCKINKKPYEKWSLIAFTLLWLFLGLRGHIYTDFISYYPYYETTTPIYETPYTHHYYEPGFILYTRLVKTIIPNYFGWVFIGTFIDLYALRFVFKRYCNSTILPFIFFLAFQGVMMEANLMRNMKALDCFFFSLPFLFNRQFLKYAAINLIGITMHISAILFIPLYFILNKELSKIFIWTAFIVVTIIYWAKLHITASLLGSYINGIELLSDRFGEYLEQGQSYGFTFGYFERTLTFILFTLLYTKLKSNRKTNIIFYNCAFWYYICHIFFDDVAVIAERVPFLFIIGYWVLYPNVLECKYKMRPTINVGIYILVFLKIFLSYSTIASKYQNVILGVDSYENRSIEVMNSFNEFNKSRQ